MCKLLIILILHGHHCQFNKTSINFRTPANPKNDLNLTFFPQSSSNTDLTIFTVSLLGCGPRNTAVTFVTCAPYGRGLQLISISFHMFMLQNTWIHFHIKFGVILDDLRWRTLFQKATLVCKKDETDSVRTPNTQMDCIIKNVTIRVFTTSCYCFRSCPIVHS